jgi:hypothetical protein
VRLTPTTEATVVTTIIIITTGTTIATTAGKPARLRMAALAQHKKSPHERLVYAAREGF